MELAAQIRRVSRDQARRLFDEAMAHPCVQVMSEQELDYIRECYEGRPENMPHLAHIALLLPNGVCLAHVHPLNPADHYIDCLFVYPSHRRRGLASAMINAMQPWIAGPLPESLDFYRTLDCRLYRYPHTPVVLAVNTRDEAYLQTLESGGAVLCEP